MRGQSFGRPWSVLETCFSCPANWWHQFEQPFEGTASLTILSYDSPGALPAPMRDIRMRIAALFFFYGSRKWLRSSGTRQGMPGQVKKSNVAAMDCELRVEPSAATKGFTSFFAAGWRFAGSFGGLAKFGKLQSWAGSLPGRRTRWSKRSHKRLLSTCSWMATRASSCTSMVGSLVRSGTCRP